MKKYSRFALFITLAALATLCPTIASHAQVPAGYTLVWSDDFSNPETVSVPGIGTRVIPNRTDWFFEEGKMGTAGELQTYQNPTKSGTDQTVMVRNGNLVITAARTPSKCTSGRIGTNKSWTYGYFEMSAKFSTVLGTFPAFWMLPIAKEGPDYTVMDGELDIMEHAGNDADRYKIWFSAHMGNRSNTASRTVNTCGTAFHLYSMEWTEDYVKGFVDGYNYFTYNNPKNGIKGDWPYNVPFYLKLNLALGAWGGTPASTMSAEYEIEYVKVYQKTGNTANVYTVVAPEGTNVCYMIGDATGDPLWRKWLELERVGETNTFTIETEYSGEFQLSSGPDWDYVECTNASGECLQKDEIVHNGPGTYTVLRWKDVYMPTATPFVKLENCEINFRVFGNQIEVKDISGQVMLYTVTGQCVQNETVNGYFISKELSKGVYILLNRNLRTKIIIQ